MIILVVVVDGGTVVVGFSVSEWLFGMVDELGNMLLILIVRVMISSSCQRIYIHSMETSVMIGAIIEVLRIVVVVVMSRSHVRLMRIDAGI